MKMKNTQEVSIMDLEMLTQGSVWVRKNGKQSRVLFVTNTSLPQEKQTEYPPTVVYADENDNVYSVTLPQFLAKRTFFNIEPALEDRLVNLLAYSPDDSGVEDFSLDDDDSLLISEPIEAETQDTESVSDTQVTAEPTQVNAANEPAEPEYAEPINVFPVSYHSDSSGLPEALSPQLLAELTECYQQQPIVSEGRLFHTLYIRADSRITREKLLACFSPSSGNAIFTFSVDMGIEGTETVDWDTLIGIYPYAFQHIRMYQVVFATDTEFLSKLKSDTATTQLEQPQPATLQTSAPMLEQLVANDGFTQPVVQNEATPVSVVTVSA
jgi:hypothetical protein